MLRFSSTQKIRFCKTAQAAHPCVAIWKNKYINEQRHLLLSLSRQQECSHPHRRICGQLAAQVYASVEGYRLLSQASTAAASFGTSLNGMRCTATNPPPLWRTNQAPHEKTESLRAHFAWLHQDPTTYAKKIGCSRRHAHLLESGWRGMPQCGNEPRRDMPA